ncbi:MAG: hypothetical protein IT303_18590 [Dehalococcoidia bacterium]|nr:hypothetical protein [Dehalococcoidia bacterium]
MSSHVDVLLRGPNGREAMVQCILESGELPLVVDAEVLRELGIRRTGDWRVIAPTGEVHRRRTGRATVAVSGHTARTRVVFGEPADACLVGAQALADLHLQVHPTRHELIALEAN